MTGTSPLLRDHTEYNVTGMAVRNSMQLAELVKLGPHRWPHRALCLSATKMLNIKHPYQMHPYERSGGCSESYQLHFIIM